MLALTPVRPGGRTSFSSTSYCTTEKWIVIFEPTANVRELLGWLFSWYVGTNIGGNSE